MKLYIPEIGDKIVLTEPWTFTLVVEHRNRGLFQKIIGNDYAEYKTRIVCIPENTELRIDRVYIRKGIAGFSSITFWVTSGDYKGARFWAKLSDVNRIGCDVVDTNPNKTIPTEPKKVVEHNIDWEVWHPPYKPGGWRPTRSCHGKLNGWTRFRIHYMYIHGREWYELMDKDKGLRLFKRVGNAKVYAEKIVKSEMESFKTV